MQTMKVLLQKYWIANVLCAMALLSSPPLRAQQQPKDAAPPAPMPASITNAKKAFISNAPGGILPTSLGGPDRPYNEFYAAMKTWGHYELVSDPVNADLVFEISYDDSLSGVGGTGSSGCSSASNENLRLVIVDPKSRTPLWWFSDSFAIKSGFMRKTTLDSNFLHSVAALVDDVKKLVGP
ncbi:MAG: hypothetical protein WA755_05215 [Candidatus Acidiferrales bacterium]